MQQLLCHAWQGLVHESDLFITELSENNKINITKKKPEVFAVKLASSNVLHYIIQLKFLTNVSITYWCCALFAQHRVQNEQVSTHTHLFLMFSLPLCPYKIIINHRFFSESLPLSQYKSSFLSMSSSTHSIQPINMFHQIHLSLVVSAAVV